jgi:pre-mRNA-processing factor 39
MVHGRGSIADVGYNGDDEAAPEIRRLLADVVWAPAQRHA